MISFPLPFFYPLFRRDCSSPPERPPIWPLLILLVVLCIFDLLLSNRAFAQVALPGSDASSQLEAAGTLLRIIDTALFKWTARILAGVCILASGWSLKEQRFGVSLVCIIGAIIFGTAPTWVKNIFEIGGSGSLFSERRIEMRLKSSGDILNG